MSIVPAPEYGKTDKETINNLMDTTFKLRKELNHLLYHLDDDNIPSLAGIKGDIAGNHTAIQQTEEQITLLAADVAGNKASITVQAGQIESLITDVSGFESSITQLANEIDLKVNANGVISAINISPETIRLLSSRIDLIGATTFRSGVEKDYITINDNTLMFQEYATGNAKMAFGFVPDRNGVNIPGVVFGAGSGQGHNRGYITKDADSLDIFYISATGVVNYISLDQSGIKLNDKIIPVADQDGKLVDSYIASATSWNSKISESTMKSKLQDPVYDITIPKENIGVLGSENIDYASITTAVIQNLTVGTAQIQDLAVTNAKIANLSVDSAKIADLAVTRAKIGEAAIGAAQIDSAVITYAHIANATIKTANIENAAITTALIATGAIDTAQIKNGSITDAKIVNLTANKIDAGTLSVERLVIRDPVTPSNSLVYAINNISGALQSVQGDTLNGEILTPRTITADRIVAGAITANEIAAGTITANEIATGAITAASGIIASIDASKITTGTLSADRISGGTISGVTVDVSTTATVGNLLQVGGSSGVKLESNNGLWIKAFSSPSMRLWSNGTWFDGNIAITNNSEIGVHTGISGSSWTPLITLTTSQVTIKQPLVTSHGITAGGALKGTSIESTGDLYISTDKEIRRGTSSIWSTAITLNTSGNIHKPYSRFDGRAQFYENVRFEKDLVFYGPTNIRYSTSSQAWSTDAGVSALLFENDLITMASRFRHNGSALSFFNKSLVNKQSVTAPSALTMPTTAPTSYTSTWGGQVRTDVNNLRTTVDALRTALINYGLL